MMAKRSESVDYPHIYPAHQPRPLYDLPIQNYSNFTEKKRAFFPRPGIKRGGVSFKYSWRLHFFHNFHLWNQCEQKKYNETCSFFLPPKRWKNFCFEHRVSRLKKECLTKTLGCQLQRLSKTFFRQNVELGSVPKGLYSLLKVENNNIKVKSRTLPL